MEIEKYQVETTRTARFYTAGTLSPQTRHIWFVLHGYGQLAEYFLKSFEPVLSDDTLVVAPEGLSRFYLGENKWERVGASWMTKEERAGEISDQVAYLNQVYDRFAGYIAINQAKVTLLGFSQGTATAWRWLRDGRVKPSNLVVWSGSIPPEYSAEMAEKLHKTNVFVTYGNEDPYLNQEKVDLQLDQLRAIKPKVDVSTFEDGHRVNPEALLSLNTRLREAVGAK